MTESSPTSDSFNARWVSPENVADTFVPIPQFRQLLHNSHSLLLGPRGCGKTTLLKMLTRRAQEKWRSADRATKFDFKFAPPGFEAVYIPSDVRWSYEVRGIPEAILSQSALTTRAQRLMIAVNTIFHFLGTVRDLIENDRPLERKLCEQLINRLGLKSTLPTVRDTLSSLDFLAADVRGSVSSGDGSILEETLALMPPFLFGHALDPVMSVIILVSEHLNESN